MKEMGMKNFVLHSHFLLCLYFLPERNYKKLKAKE